MSKEINDKEVVIVRGIEFEKKSIEVFDPCVFNIDTDEERLFVIKNGEEIIECFIHPKVILNLICGKS